MEVKLRRRKRVRDALKDHLTRNTRLTAIMLIASLALSIASTAGMVWTRATNGGVIYTITVAGGKNDEALGAEARIVSVRRDGAAIDLDRYPGEYHGGHFVIHPYDGEVSLHIRASVRDVFSVLFVKHPWSGEVKIHNGMTGQETVADLYSAEDAYYRYTFEPDRAAFFSGALKNIGGIGLAAALAFSLIGYFVCLLFCAYGVSVINNSTANSVSLLNSGLPESQRLIKSLAAAWDICKGPAILLLSSAAIAFIFEGFVLAFTNNRVYIEGGSNVIVPHRIINGWRVMFVFISSFALFMNNRRIKAFFTGAYWQAAGILKDRRVLLRIALANGAWFACVFVLFYFMPGAFYHGYPVFCVFSSIIVTSIVLYACGYIRKIETLVFICAACVCVIYILTMPLFTQGGDNSTHFNRTRRLSRVFLERRWGQYGGVIRENDGFYPLEHLRQAIASNGQPVILPHNHNKPWFPYLPYRYVAYLPFVAFMVMADAFNLPPLAGYYAGLIGNSLLLVWVFCRGAAKLKSGKLILVCFMLLPAMLRLLSTYTYNGWMVVWLSYAAACIIGIMQRGEGEGSGWKEWLCIMGAFQLALMVKAPYLFMVLLVFLVPGERFASVKMKRFVYAAAISVILIAAASLILPGLTSPEGFDMRMYSDTRGGEGVSALDQLRFIFSNPVQYTGTLLRTLLEKLSPAAYIFGRDGFLNIRHFTQSTFGFMFIIFLLAAMCIDHNKNVRQISIRTRLLLLFICFINACVIATSMYMNYTEVGEPAIAGLNPLYLHAALYPAFHVLGTSKIRCPVPRRVYNTAIFSGIAGLLLLNIYLHIMLLFIH